MQSPSTHAPHPNHLSNTYLTIRTLKQKLFAFLFKWKRHILHINNHLKASLSHTTLAQHEFRMSNLIQTHLGSCEKSSFTHEMCIPANVNDSTSFFEIRESWKFLFRGLFVVFYATWFLCVPYGMDGTFFVFFIHRDKFSVQCAVAGNVKSRSLRRRAL